MEKCWGEVLEKSVGEKCCREECCREVLQRSVGEERWRRLLEKRGVRRVL